MNIRMQWRVNENKLVEYQMITGNEVVVMIMFSLTDFRRMAEEQLRWLNEFESGKLSSADVGAAIAEAERILQVSKDSPELRDQAGRVVGLTDVVYLIDKPDGVFRKVSLKQSAIPGELWYNGRKLLITSIDVILGLVLIGPASELPVATGVHWKAA